jgi:hypothetical protein
VRRGFGRRTRRSGGAYHGVVKLAIGALGIGAVILFLLQRARGDVREKAERASETAKSTAEEYVGTSRTEMESQETVERSGDQKKDAVENPEESAAEAPTEERKRAVRGFVNRLEENPVDQEEHSADQEENKGAEGIREELRRIVRESVRRSEESSWRDREESSSEETEVEESEQTSEGETASEQVTVVGLLAKMGESFEETDGGKFILSSEDEGNFDLHGKEDELDEIYEQQLQAKVVGRITDEDTQPKVMEVDGVETA